ncbi:hypothetical protein [Lysobacter sp. CA196]|uniref:hypothetical protein n=1 Tax=Lysobacter sp. CA196 TaxID=3455606 RepID=UPI003F8D0897
MRKIAALSLMLGLAACQSGTDAAPADAAASKDPSVAAPAAPAATAEAQKAIAERAFVALRKLDPGFERLGFEHLVGDLDRDGQDDVVVLFGQGTPDATMAASKKLMVLMNRGNDFQALPQADMPEFCPELDKISSGRLYLRAIDICSAARPKTTDYYVYAWNGKTVLEAEHQSRQQRVVAELAELGRALRMRDKNLVLGRMNFPLEAIGLPIYETALEKAAAAAGGKIDRALAEKHYTDLFPDSRADTYAETIEQALGQSFASEPDGTLVASRSQQRGKSEETYSISIQPDPDADREEGNDELIDAQVSVIAAVAEEVEVSDGEGGKSVERQEGAESLILHLIDGRLRLAAFNVAG